ncbi:hypothetical protein BH10PSE4_BH10PSE4_11560 [soil metagenome]
MHEQLSGRVAPPTGAAPGFGDFAGSQEFVIPDRRVARWSGMTTVRRWGVGAPSLDLDLRRE